jgi:hypothetical protein
MFKPGKVSEGYRCPKVGRRAFARKEAGRKTLVVSSSSFGLSFSRALIVCLILSLWILKQTLKDGREDDRDFYMDFTSAPNQIR